MDNMKKDLTTSVFTFEDLIQGNFLYVDKTEYIWQLIRPAQGMYFLSRPRRFGKSLLISTLKAIFEGKKELFKELALYDKPYEWEKYPIIHLSFGDYSVVSDALEELPGYLMSKMRKLANAHSIELTETNPGLCFAELIDRLAARKQVVILIDEYDKPILSNILDKNIKVILKILKGFYSVLKDRNAQERLLFVTGVSKFCHVSLFSELNNLTDITLKSKYAGMLGFTEEEIRHNFADRISEAAKENGFSNDELMSQLLEWYDGYRFSKADIHVCNPVSISSFFDGEYEFANYWDNTGTPSFLLELMSKQSYDFEAALKGTYDEGVFAAYELDKLDITGLLWQTGYLTIKDVVHGMRKMKYRLGFPDYEIEDTFMTRLLEYFCDVPQGTGEDTMEDFQKTIAEENLDGFMKMFQSFLANIPYSIHLKHEKYYQSVFFIFFRLLGLFIKAESQTNEGRIDAYIQTDKTVYIFEFKLDKTSDAAIDQIIDRHYYEKFQSCGLPIQMIGVNFNSEKGRIDGWKEMPLPSKQ